MRTKSAQALAILGNPSHSARAIVTVYSSAGVAKVLDDTGLQGIIEPVLDVEIEQSVDAFRTARVTLRRQQGRYSLAPLVTANNPLYGSEPVIDVARRIVIEVELLPADMDVAPSGVRETVFDGFIDELEWPDDDLRLVCTDKGAKLRDRWIERERVYCFAESSYLQAGCLVWSEENMPALAVGDYVIPSDTRRTGFFYKVTAASGPQLVAEPTWPTVIGNTVVSGGVTLRCEQVTDASIGVDVEQLLQYVINDNGLSAAATVQIPTGSPGWFVKPYKQQRQSVWEALQAIVDQLGWRLSFEWSSSLGRYELALLDPGRGSVTVHKVLTEDDEVECSDVGINVWDIRNVVRVIYGESGTRSGNGTPVRLVREVSDAASIAKYGRRFMEVGEADSSNIDTAGEADRMAAAILADLKEPTIGVSVSFSHDPYLEIGDRITLPSDGLRWSTGPTLAVQSLRHTISGTSARTEVTLRGNPAAGLTRYLDMDGRVNPADLHAISLMNTSETSLTINETVGGTRFQLSGDRTKDALGQSTEIHISDTPGFTPIAATLLGSTQSDGITASHLVPGKTYYVKTLPWARNGDRIVRGAPSAEVSFVAGRAKAGHYDSRATQSHLPLNGNFEHATEGITVAAPDQWEVKNYQLETGESWGSAGSVYYGTDATKGQYVELRANAGRRGNIESSAFEVRRGNRAMNIYLSIQRFGASANTGKDLILDILGYQDSALTNLITNWSWTFSGSASGPYPSLGVWYDVVLRLSSFSSIPANVNFLKLRLRRGTTGDNTFGWRIGDVYAQEADFDELRAGLITADSLTVNTSLVVPSSFWTQPAWTGFSYLNNHADHSVGNTPGQYFKDSFGFVHLRGLIKRTVAGFGSGVPITTLPTGYRPAYTHSFWTWGGATPKGTKIVILTNGNVFIEASDSATPEAIFALDGIHFDTRS